jgi:arylsulfatase A-like enzyme
MPSRRPNIVVILTDDQRFDTIAALGNAQVRTPNLDRLVRMGTTFTQAHIPCGTSPAVCMPSRAMLHSGRTLFHLAGAGEGIPAAHTTLGEALRGSGYRTFGTGKWHNGPASYQRSFGEGDEIFFGGMADHWNVPACHYDLSGRYDCRAAWTEHFMTDNTVRYRLCDHIHPGRHSTDLIAAAADGFLRGGDTATPFFLYVSFLAPHDPRTMPKEYLDLYDPERLELPPNVVSEHPFDTGALRIRDELLAGFPRQPKEIRRHLAEYYAMITHLDAGIGRLLAALDERGLTEDTLIVLAGDNGLALGQHGLMGKQNCYEHSIRVPLVFAGPGIPRDTRSPAYAYLLDVFPTLCELADTHIPASVEGTSLVPALRSPQEPIRDTLYFAYTDSQRAVKDRQFKLIEYVTGGRHSMTQLFDLAHDPWETRNLADEPEQAPTVERLRREMVRWRDAWDDPASPWGKTFWKGYAQG